MESVKLEKRLDDIDDTIRRLRLKIQEVARYAVRVDRDVEDLDLHVQKLRFPNDERLKDVEPCLRRLERQADKLRRSTRGRITGDRNP